MATAQSLITEARYTLNDVDSPQRFSDDDLLVGLNDGLKLIRAVRPDLWYGSLATPLTALTALSAFPLAPEYEPAMKKYIVHYAEMRDDEYVQSGRSKAFLEQFVNEVVTPV